MKSPILSLISPTLTSFAVLQGNVTVFCHTLSGKLPVAWEAWEWSTVDFWCHYVAALLAQWHSSWKSDQVNSETWANVLFVTPTTALCT